jgi:hypothetical protein
MLIPIQEEAGDGEDSSLSFHESYILKSSGVEGIEEDAGFGSDSNNSEKRVGSVPVKDLELHGFDFSRPYEDPNPVSDLMANSNEFRENVEITISKNKHKDALNQEEYLRIKYQIQ